MKIVSDARLVLFYTLIVLMNVILYLVFFWWVFLCPQPVFRFFTRYVWYGMFSVILKVIYNVSAEYRGTENILSRPVIFASRHQSVLDVQFLVLLLWKRVLFITKTWMLFIPIYGWILYRSGSIAINRKKGIWSIKKMVKQSRERVRKGYSIVIFPEGTRTKIGTSKEYEVGGIYSIYKDLNIPVVPVALNTGLLRDGYRQKSGRAIIEFLDPISAGYERDEFMDILKTRIDTATDKLVKEGV